jgi:hypothetical protein
LSLLRLKRSVEILLGVTLAVAMLAVLPGVAEAQDAASVKDDSTRIVVDPGDSLWSISSERLGPDATLRQIDKETGRIYALNQARIGPNPNLILPGQELLVAPAEGKQAASGQRAAADRSGEPVASEQPASKKGEAVAVSKPAPEKAAKKSVELQLTPSRNSGVSGTATLTDVDGGVRVELNMRGLPEAGVEHINHFHGGGTCADDRAGRTAPVTLPLNKVVAKAHGTGSATSTIKAVTLGKLFGGDQARFILVHAKTQKGQGVPPGISCADLPQDTGKGGFETLPASGGLALPALPAVGDAVPKAGSLGTGGDPSPWSTVASLANSRLFALVIIVLAVCLLALLVWTLLRLLQERRKARKRRWLWEEHYGNNYTRFDPFLSFEDTLRLARGGVPDESELGPNNGSVPAAGNGLARVEIFAAARARRQRVSRTRRRRVPSVGSWRAPAALRRRRR